MGLYLLKTGAGQALVDLLPVTPTYCKYDPTSAGIRYERAAGISGKETFRGLPFTEWVFAPTPYSEFDALMTALGVSYTTVSNTVTIYTLTKGATMARHTAIAHYPLTQDGIEKGSNSNLAYRGFTVRFTRLIAL